MNLIKYNVSGKEIPVIESRELARQIEIRHADLLEKISGYASILNERNFPLVNFFIKSKYFDGKGEERKLYFITKKGCNMVANKLTGEKGIIFTANYVTKFEQMEKELQGSKIPQTFAESLRLAADLEEQKQKLLVVNSELKPKAEFYDDVMQSKDTVDMGQLAKTLNFRGMGRNRLFEYLRKKRILDRSNQPYQKYVDCGYFRIIESKYEVCGDIRISLKTVIFQKGVDYIRKSLLQDNYIQLETKEELQ